MLHLFLPYELGKILFFEFLDGNTLLAVSYTHLDVYKRQSHCRNNRNHINIDTGLYTSQHAHREIPGDEAERGGPQSQEKKIPCVGRFQKKPRLHMKIHEKESRYHEYQSVEKGTPCGLYHGIAEIADFPGQQGICLLYTSRCV